MRKIPYNEKRRNKCEYCTVYKDGSCKWQKCLYEPEPREYRGYPMQAVFARVVI